MGNKDEYTFTAINTDLSFIATKGEVWLGNCGTQRHIICDRSLFTTYMPCTTDVKGIGSTQAIGQGDAKILFTHEGKLVPITLRNALHVTTIDFNLISLRRLTSAGLTYTGKGDHLIISDGNRAIGKGRKVSNLYHMAVKRPSSIALAARTIRSWYEWHCALGHPGKTQLFQLPRLVNGMDVDNASDRDFDCEACIQAKHAHTPFPDIATDRHYDIGDLVFSNIWGPARVESLQHNTYFITFTDAATHSSFVMFMKSRTTTLDRFKQLEKLFETQFQKRIKVLHADNAREYTEEAFKAYAAERGIVIWTTAPYLPQQNGISERINHTLVERARPMLFAHDSPHFLWEEAVSYAAYLRNRSPTRALVGKTPFEALWGRKPDVHTLREFGTPCWVLVPTSRQSKLEPKSEKYVFTGLSTHSAGWRYYVAGLRQVLILREVVFPRIPDPLRVDTDRSPPPLEGESISSPSPQPPSQPLAPQGTPQPLSSTPAPATRATASKEKAATTPPSTGLRRTDRAISPGPRQARRRLLPLLH